MMKGKANHQYLEKIPKRIPFETLRWGRNFKQDIEITT